MMNRNEDNLMAAVVHRHSSNNNKDDSNNNSKWRHSPDLAVHRQSLRKAITAILQERQDSSSSSGRRLSHQVMTLESTLLEQAPSLGAYIDRTSLRRRLREAQEAQQKQQQQLQQQQQEPFPPPTFGFFSSNNTVLTASASSWSMNSSFRSNSSMMSSFASLASDNSQGGAVAQKSEPQQQEQQEQPHQQQQQHHPQQDQPIPWQKQQDFNVERRRMTKHIFKLLEERFAKKDATNQSKAALWKMSQKLEVSLFRGSPSLPDYQKHAASQSGLRYKLLDMLNDCLSKRQGQEQHKTGQQGNGASSGEETNHNAK